MAECKNLFVLHIVVVIYKPAGNRTNSGIRAREWVVATYKQASATSSGFRALAITSGGVGIGRCRTIGVSHSPGKITVVRMPFSCSSLNVPCANPDIPCLDA